MPSRDTITALLRQLNPVLHPGTYVFATVAPNTALSMHELIASVQEPEGCSVIVESVVARRENLSARFPCAWITLTVNSDLAAAGLTAAFSAALDTAGISCNVVAGINHDHIFVPHAMAQAAMEALQQLQLRANRDTTISPLE